MVCSVLLCRLPPSPALGRFSLGLKLLAGCVGSLDEGRF